MAMAFFRLITFDSTGTLLRLREPSHEYYARVARSHGINVSAEKLKTSWISAYNYACNQQPIFGRDPIHGGWKKWWRNVIYDTLSKSLDEDKKNLDPEKFEKISEQLIEDYRGSDCWVVNDGATELLQTLKNEYKVCLGVISNFDSSLPEILEKMDLKNYFDFVLTSYEVGYEKPKPEIFQKALSLAGGLHSSQALHVGDKVNQDVAGAIAAGWNYALVNVSNIKEYPNLNPKFLFKNLIHLHGNLENTLKIE